MSHFSYDTVNDAHAYIEQQVGIGDATFDVSAVTDAGRNDFDTPQKPNDDAFSIRVEGDVLQLAVFDGATSLLPIPELQGESGARFASHILRQEAERMPRLDDPYTTLSYLNAALFDSYRHFGSIRAPGFSGDETSFGAMNIQMLPSATVTLAQLNEATNELHLGHVSDSWGAVLYDDGSTEILTNNLHEKVDNEILGLIAKIAVEQGITPREACSDARIRETLLVTAAGVRNCADHETEGIANGDPNMDRYIEQRTVSLNGVRAVLVATDGLVPPGMNERKPADRKRLLEIACSDGLEGLLHLVRTTEDHDPHRHLVRYKHGDDATGVLAIRR